MLLYSAVYNYFCIPTDFNYITLSSAFIFGGVLTFGNIGFFVSEEVHRVIEEGESMTWFSVARMTYWRLRKEVGLALSSGC